MPQKKSAVVSRQQSAKQPARRLAGRPPKVRPAKMTTKKTTTKSVVKPVKKTMAKTVVKPAKKIEVKTKPVAKTKPAIKAKSINKTKSITKKALAPVKKKAPAQPQVVVVTNQPLVTEQEFTVWEEARETPVEETMPSGNLEDYPIEQHVFEEEPEMIDEAEWLEEVELEPEQNSSRLYRRLAFFFLGLIAIVVLAMSYYSLVRVDITLFPASDVQTINKKINLTDSAPVGAEALPSKFIQETVEYKQTFLATGQEQTTGEATLAGQVVLINETGKDQPLRATTRLITSSGVLYRLKDYVNVPAGGRVTANVYADSVKAENAIGVQTKFTIPGLWAGLQEKIYAIAEQPINYQVASKPVVTVYDIDQAIAQAKSMAMQQAKDKIAPEIGSETVIYWTDENNWPVSVNAKAGENKADFTVAIKATIGAAIVNQETIENSLIDQNNPAAVINKQSLSYRLISWAPEQHQAQLEISYSSNLAFNRPEQLINEKDLVGMSRKQLDNYLNNQTNLIKYKTDWHPSFLNKVPGTDKINLKLGR